MTYRDLQGLHCETWGFPDDLQGFTMFLDMKIWELMVCSGKIMVFIAVRDGRIEK